MEKSYITEIMTIERLLLEIETRDKFNLSFNDSLKLYNFLREIGEITNFFFFIQEEFSKKYQDDEKLKSFKSKIMSEKIDFDISDYVSFIDHVLQTTDDEYIKTLILRNHFWAHK